MAGDWIKMDATLHEKPEVVRLSGILEIDRFAVVGRLHRVWSWFDQQSRNGHAVGVTKMFVDELAMRDGFATALESVGWLVQEEDGLSVPGFDRHNGKSAKSRALASERKRKSRDERDECHATSVTKAGPEKRREEKNSTHTPSGASAVDPSLTGHADSVTETGRPLPAPGFPEKQAVLDYATRQGWPVDSASKFWLHYDQARSNGDRAIGSNWHWWSALEMWVRRDLQEGASKRGGRKASITEHEPADEWEDSQLTPNFTS